ncbi:MAG: hypothetical protein LBU32_19790 [Clostridiales bacterium]|nr:hypothetical protein [Clostridiales bacterium]
MIDLGNGVHIRANACCFILCLRKVGAGRAENSAPAYYETFLGILKRAQELSGGACLNQQISEISETDAVIKDSAKWSGAPVDFKNGLHMKRFGCNIMLHEGEKKVSIRRKKRRSKASLYSNPCFYCTASQAIQGALNLSMRKAIIADNMTFDEALSLYKFMAHDFLENAGKATKRCKANLNDKQMNAAVLKAY